MADVMAERRQVAGTSSRGVVGFILAGDCPLATGTNMLALMAEFVLPLLVFGLTLASLIDIITRPDGSIQHLPKMIWIVLVILLPVIGGILWFTVGRSYEPASRNGGGRYAESFHRGEPAVLHARVTSTRVSTTERELAELDREIEYYEKQARLKKLQGEAGAGVDSGTSPTA